MINILHLYKDHPATFHHKHIQCKNIQPVKCLTIITWPLYSSSFPSLYIMLMVSHHIVIINHCRQTAAGSTLLYFTHYIYSSFICIGINYSLVPGFKSCSFQGKSHAIGSQFHPTIDVKGKSFQALCTSCTCKPVSHLLHQQQVGRCMG
jgi:hypothetical protein